MKKYLGVLLLLVSCSTPGQFTLKEDNDFFSPFTKNRDQYYTQGAEFTNTYADQTGSHSYGIGQLIYTPGHDSLTVPQPNERPYAGYLYAKYGAQYDTGTDETVWSIAPGIVGPHSYAEQTQSGFHNLIGDRIPGGWQFQLNDEPTLEVTYERRYLVINHPFINNISVLGINGGTPLSQTYASSMFKIGYNPPAFGQDVIFPRGTERPPFRAYFLLGPLVRAVAWNTFLDGNAWQSSASVDKKPLVLEGRVGLGVEYEGYTITFTDMVQTAEYDGQASGDKFAEVSLGFDF